MQLTSSRFGPIDVPDDAVVDFPGGLVGLGGNRYALLARGAGGPFLWLQSLDDPNLALPIVNPWDHFPDYSLELAPADAERLGSGAGRDAALYVTVRAGEGGRFSANLRAPILIVGSTGHQVINQAADADVRAPLP